MKRLHLVLTLGVVLAFLVLACESNVLEPDTANYDATGTEADTRGFVPGQTNMVEIVGGHDHDHEDPEWWLDINKQEIPSGWTTLKFDNQTSHTHFIYMVKVSDDALMDLNNIFESPPLSDFNGATLAEKWMNAVNQPFQDAWDPYYEGDTDINGFVGALVAGVPDWFLAPGHVATVGGPGFTSGGVTSTMTQYLDEGTYLMECYVMDEEGRFHSPYGMVTSLVVTDEHRETAEPTADLNVSISSNGITFDEEDLRPGRYTVGITFEENQLYPNFLGHDVHLLRKDANTDVLDYWMNYLDPVPGEIDEEETLIYGDRGALVSTHNNPGPETFLGGVQDIFAGSGPGFVEDDYPVTAYFHVTLKPGDYAWVAEVADPEGNDMLKEFTVSPPGRALGR